MRRAGIGLSGTSRIAFLALLLAGSRSYAVGPMIAVPEGDIRWGYDGTVMRDRFNPLSLVLDNPSPEPFDGEVRLYRADFGGRRVGGFLSETVYLAPATRRLVQFYPFVMSDRENWVLAWDGGEVTLPPPALGTPARVFLSADGDLFDRGGPIKRFPSRNFPGYVTATDGLGEIVMDRAPEWDAPRSQAFFDWLRSGGTLHLVLGPDGRRPEFDGDLAPLNEPSEEFRIGAGSVRRHDVGRGGLTADYVRRTMDPPPPDAEPSSDGERANEFGVYEFPLEEWQMSANAFSQLKQMVTVEHNWGMIHLLSLSYVAVLFPGCFLVGREFRSAPVTFGAIAGSTLLFGGAFYLVGNRGYGESTSVHAVALAEHVEGSRFDVTQWSSVFVTAGGDYRFAHAGEERIYSDATSNEAVNGVATAGTAGTFVADVPPFSTRVLTHKALVRLPPAAAPTADPRSNPATPSFTLPSGFPAETKVAYAVLGDRVFPYRKAGARLEPSGVPEPAEEFLMPRNADFLDGDAGAWGEEPDAGGRMAQLAKPLMLHSLRLSNDDDLKTFRVPDGRAKLFVYCPLPPQLSILSGPADSEEPAEPMAGQSGSVLYAFDVPL